MKNQNIILIKYGYFIINDVLTGKNHPYWDGIQKICTQELD